jgi:glycosyltransferase involved in cell wall biosynthesis
VHLELYVHADPAAARRAARAELGLAPDALVLGFVGYYRDWHRLDLVVEALPSLPGAELVLVGEGPARADLERRAQAAGVARRVHFAGPRPHARIPALLAAFDIALLPAINPYASPLKLHEYMASALPVIAPDQPNLREVLGQHENALLVPPGDGAALLAALRELAGDAARRTIVERDLTWRGNAQRVIAAVEGLR